MAVFRPYEARLDYPTGLVANWSILVRPAFSRSLAWPFAWVSCLLLAGALSVLNGAFPLARSKFSATQKTSISAWMRAPDFAGGGTSMGERKGLKAELVNGKLRVPGETANLLRRHFGGFGLRPPR